MASKRPGVIASNERDHAQSFVNVTEPVRAQQVPALREPEQAQQEQVRQALERQVPVLVQQERVQARPEPERVLPGQPPEPERPRARAAAANRRTRCRPPGRQQGR